MNHQRRWLCTLTFLPSLLSPASIAFAQEQGGRDPASTVISVPKSTAPRPALREIETKPPVATKDDEKPYLTGDWRGTRTALSETGVDLGLILKYEAGRNMAGGLKIGSYGLWNLDIRAAVDTEKMGAWKGGSFFLYYLVNQGDHPTEFVGDIQATSNLETSMSVSRIYEAWFQQLFFNEKASILLGLHDLNSEFYVTETSGLFFNASFGIGQEMAQGGSQGPSIFPVTAPAIRVRVEPNKSLYVQAAAFSGMAGDLNHPQGTHIRWGSDEGSLLIAEAAYVRGQGEGSEDLSSKYAVGGWAYTKATDHHSAGVTDANGVFQPEQTTNSGAYVLIDQGLTPSSAAFLRAGVAANNPATNVVDSNVSAGFVFEKPFSSRPNDLVGVGITAVAASSTFRNSQASAGTPIAKYETTTELTYRAEIGKGLALQPDLQYVDKPSFNTAIAYAINASIRLQIDF